MHSVLEVPPFTIQADSLFGREEREALIDYLATHAGEGDPIPGTGGVMKLRVPAKGKGKRGGARVIYYYVDDGLPVFALAVYAKNVATDLTSKEKKAVSAFAHAIKTARRRAR